MRGILTYHSIDPSGSAISVDRAAFESHVRWLSSGAVRVVPLSELVRVPPDEDAVALTFDDALESFRSVAAPLLLDAGLPVTVFAVSDQAGGTNRWGEPGDATVPEFRLLDWDALGHLASRGVEVGAHTRSHPDLTRLGGDAVRDEIQGGLERIERELGVRPRSFAYPFGRYDDRAVAIASELFDHAVTADLDVLDTDPSAMKLPRLEMIYFRRDGLLESWGTPAFRRYLWLRRAGRRLGAVARRRWRAVRAEGGR